LTYVSPVLLAHVDVEASVPGNHDAGIHGDEGETVRGENQGEMAVLHIGRQEIAARLARKTCTNINTIMLVHVKLMFQ